MALAQNQTKAWGMYSGTEMEEKDAFKVSPEVTLMNDDDSFFNKLFKNVEEILISPQNNVYKNVCMNEEAELSKNYGPPDKQPEFLKNNIDVHIYQELVDFQVHDEKLNALEFI